MSDSDDRPEVLVSAPRDGASPLSPRPDDPPVVARLVVEIRSDGTRTIARGAMEDRVTGELAQVEAEGTTPSQLASALVKSLVKLPLDVLQRPELVRGLVKGLLAGREKKR